MVATILLPPLRISGIPDIRFDLIIIILAWGIYLGDHISSERVIVFQHIHIIKWFGIFGLVICLSILYASLIKGYPLILRDTFELIKLLKYFLIFSFVANLTISHRDFQLYCELAIIIFLMSAFIGFAQFFNLFNMNAYISPYYAPTQMQGLLLHGRITGTTGNPNEFGALMVFAASLSLALALFAENSISRLFCWFSISVFCLAVFLTLSRSAIIILIVSYFIILLMKYPLKNKNFIRHLGKLLIVIIFISIIISFLLNFVPQKFFFRVSELVSLSTASSWKARLIMWQDTLAIWQNSVLFGWGPAKKGMTTIVDNEWLLLLRRYGIVGLTVFLLWFLNFYRDLYVIKKRLNKIWQSSSTIGLIVCLQSMLISYALYMIPAAVYHDLQTFPILLIFIGLVYSQAITSKKT
ncbi:O-antigen ligase family protein [Flexistipes sp.]|uniref:O-antigen ligase family protein n=1 Tax=Flexistipes sp. TaxID=3088135 RepID=UPI002E1CEDD6|nr:O-antigen ligase family protein [Flexistipes sp.]